VHERVRVIGRGRVGTELAARVEARDLIVSDDLEPVSRARAAFTRP
jgi:hypothetical protein